MTATADTRLRGRTRWSLAARCPRMAGYALLGEEPAPASEEEQLRWKRGQLDERWFIDEVLIPRFGADNVIEQKVVPWGIDALPVGELHTDAFIVSEGMPWEIKSHADGEPADFDFVQLAGEILHDPDATKDAGVLAIIDRDLGRDYIPVVVTDELRDQVYEIAGQVVGCARTGELPPRVCAKPADGRARMCPYVSTCFAGWTPPDPIRLDADVATLALDVMHAQTVKRDATRAADEADQVYKERAAMLAEYDLPAGVTCVGPGVKVKRTAFPDSERFSISKARKSGIWTPADDERFAPFVSWSGAHDRWAIEQTVVSVDAEDFGDVAPWDDDDLEGPTF